MIRRLAPMVLAFAGILCAQATHTPTPAPEPPDAGQVKSELENLLSRYPPAVRRTLALDSSLLGNQPYMAPYPALVSYLAAHPEIARNPSYYLNDGSGGGNRPPQFQDQRSQIMEMWREVFNSLEIFAGFGMAIGVVTWLIRTIIDYRRWSRLERVQAEVHAKLLDRFTANNDLLAYMQSPAGARFLESTPIKLDTGPRSVAAPLARILWSVQGGFVLMAGGTGLELVSARYADEISQPLHVLGVLGIALGLGFLVSAGASFLISQRLGLIEPPPAPRFEGPSPEGLFRK